MKISTNNSNNIKNISKFSFNRWGNGSPDIWLTQHNNWLIKFSYGIVKLGDTVICYGNGAMWKVNNKIFCWMTTGTQQYVIVDITTNGYSFDINGNYVIYDIL